MSARALLLLILLTGCPGISRPPPGSHKATTTPTASPPPTTETPSPSPSATEAPRERFARQLEGLLADAGEFLAAPGDHRAWQGLVDRMQEVENMGFALLESEPDPAAVEDALLELADLRGELVEAEPR